MPTLKKYHTPTIKRPGYMPLARVGQSYSFAGGPRMKGPNENRMCVRCTTCGTASVFPVRSWAYKADKMRECPNCGQPFMYVKSPWKQLPWTAPEDFRLEDYDQPEPETMRNVALAGPVPEQPGVLLERAVGTLREELQGHLLDQDNQIGAAVDLLRQIEQRLVRLENVVKYELERNGVTAARAVQRLNGIATDRPATGAEK